MNLYFFQKINDLAGKNGFLDSTGIFFAQYFGYALAILAIVLFWRKRKIIFQAFLAAVLARFAFVELVRWLWPIARPFIENNGTLLVNHAVSSSFPSGHAAFFFGLATVIFFYSKKIGALFIGASFLIAISRVFVGVHWPADILAGASMGILSACLVLIISEKRSR
ncbi:MAG: phosphatase PAP2 family protein [Candidatus Nealsonbacteria bacterium]|nr:phosphatase PAP2 family protein [Candidatus Nealsonbacteria bacterium]